ncbi:chromosome segregation protein SMC [Clostridium sp.]|uniref:chromosome segregation protein SMC n=1 Tax=Clostridium sp. TaxID=1506 RepID=UPI0025BA1C10|nr:chromosome segregation protein SMC [Clostridium sp.]MCI9070668.1 chromosome segregation protein SMC [Clostridium sp.]
MFLKSLEIRGFKSFADKTELRFKGGVTAVVGPNGSGKSNVSDSVRWVLGEQSVKNLRGGKMEDVIFSGTQFRKPLGLAQVSLTLDNSDGTLSTDYNEVTVTRRIFRSGETEYLINNQKCRLKDITELFMDTGIGKEGYSIIGQGKIDAILSGKPEDRRALLEEAAGIVKYKARKEEAEKRLDNTDSNLVRIRDIIATYEERLEPLKVEKEKAEKYKFLAEELKVKEVSILVNNIDKISKDIDILSNEIEKREKSIEEKREKFKIHKSILDELQDKIENIENKSKLEKDEYYTKKEEYTNHIRDIDLFKERINNFKSLIEKEENEIKLLKENLEKVNLEKRNLEEKLNERSKENSEKALEIKSVESLIDEISIKINKIEKELSILKNNEFEIISKNSDITNKIQSLEKEIKEKSYTQENLDKSIVTLEGNLSINIGTIEEVKATLINAKDNILKLEEEIILVKRELTKTHSLLNSQDNKIKILAKKINESEATHNTLENLEKHYEGYNRTVKNLMEHVAKGKVFGVKDIKVLGEVFEVEKKYEVAIEIALGGAISNVITISDIDAKNLISYLKSKGLGRATFLPLNIIKGKKLEVPNEIKSAKGYIGVASDIIKYDMKYKGIIDYNLGRTIIAENMDYAINISKIAKHNYKIVTLTGEVINPGGALTGGSIQGKSANLLGRKREIEELAENIINLKDEYNNEVSKFNDIKVKIKSLDEEILNKREEVHSKNIELTVLEGEMKNLLSDKDKLNKNIESSKKQKDENNNIINLLTEKLKSKKDELDKLDVKSFERKEKVKLIEEELFNNNNERDSLKEKLVNLKVNNATLEESLQNQKSQISFKNLEIKEKENKIANLQIEISNKYSSITALSENVKSKEGILEEIEKRVLELENSFREDEIIKAELKESYKAKESVTSEEIEVIRIEENELNKKSIQYAKIESEQEAFYNRLNSELNLTLAEAKEIAVKIENINKIKDEILILKSKIASLGTVNLSAIVEYDEVCEKYEFMSSQELDLQKAKEELMEVINEMTIQMQELFKENFKVLNENFGETFRELFKGGHAELILGGEDILNSNIIINVEPPGKKLQNINLMSGGEKVLSAIALLFAILKMKPTPFCILDEIEAALDDANVYRYAEFLKAFAKNIQFIVITHRKGTMEASDVMYGITMEEKGISKVVSVDLSKN